MGVRPSSQNAGQFNFANNNGQQYILGTGQLPLAAPVNSNNFQTQTMYHFPQTTTTQNLNPNFTQNNNNSNIINNSQNHSQTNNDNNNNLLTTDAKTTTTATSNQISPVPVERSNSTNLNTSGEMSSNPNNLSKLNSKDSACGSSNIGTSDNENIEEQCLLQASGDSQGIAPMTGNLENESPAGNLPGTVVEV